MTTAQTRAMSPEHRAAISKAKLAKSELEHRIKAFAIEARAELAQDTDFARRFGNYGTAYIGKLVNAERVEWKINEDGTRMGLAQEIEFRERHEYGTKEMLKKLRAKLEGTGTSEETKLDDEQLLALLNVAA